MKHKRTLILDVELETLLRREKDKVRKLSMRGSETYKETICTGKIRIECTWQALEPLKYMNRLCTGKSRDRVHKVSMRASETCEETLHRQQQNKMLCMHVIIYVNVYACVYIILSHCTSARV